MMWKVNIVNIITNVGEQLKSVNWVEAGVTFASVFFGALFAYKFGLKLEMRKAKRQMRGDFCTLASQVYLNLCQLINYKKLNLDIIKQDFDNNKFPNFYYFEDLPKTDFSFDINKYIFLNDCNRYLLSELSQINIIDKSFKKSFLNYFSNMNNAYYTKIHPSIDFDETFNFFKRNFDITYKSYMEFCTSVYYLNLHLVTCYKKFFNVNYFDDLDKHEEIDDLIKEIPEEILQNENFIKLNNEVNNYWKPAKTLKNDLKFLYRMCKHKIFSIKKYFFYSEKTKNEKNNHK